MEGKKHFTYLPATSASLKFLLPLTKRRETELRKYLYSVYDKYLADGSLFNDVFEKAEKWQGQQDDPQAV